MNATPVVPIANPKGTKYQCELCGRSAHLQCSKCRVTFYCDKTHMTLDHKGIHDRICQLLIPLRTPMEVLGTDEEREHREKQANNRRLQILEICKLEAHRKLYEEQFDVAVPAALQALRFSMDIHGKDSVELVPSYLLLGEASIGLKQLHQAEDYLSMAKWAVMKSNECDYEIKAQLSRNFGLLYASQANYDGALDQLSEDVYYLSLLHGPQNVAVAGGYFQIGKVYEHLDQKKKASAIFDHVVQAWTDHFSSTDKERTPLDEARVAEGLLCLAYILAFHQQTLHSHVDKQSPVEYVISRLHAEAHDWKKAETAAESALVHAQEAKLTSLIDDINRHITLVRRHGSHIAPTEK